MTDYITCDDAKTALDSLDDYARMDVGVDAFGPRGVLEGFILQVEQAEMRSRFIPVGGGYRPIETLVPGAYGPMAATPVVDDHCEAPLNSVH